MLIEIENLSWSNNRQPAVQDVTFGLEAGEHAVLLGCNGCGKSTLLRLLNGLIHPDSGSIHYDGQQVDRRALANQPFHRRFRHEVGLLFQDPAAMLFHSTVADEIAYGPRQFKLSDPVERARQWATTIGADHLWERTPAELSRGEQQRVALASILVLEPRVLLLDEPTASLDPRSTGWLVDFLMDHTATILTATHNLSLATELGDRALVLGEDHRLHYDGDVLALRDNHEVLLHANLMHTHRHRHRRGDIEHRHYHTHDWD